MQREIESKKFQLNRCPNCGGPGFSLQGGCEYCGVTLLNRNLEANSESLTGNFGILRLALDVSPENLGDNLLTARFDLRTGEDLTSNPGEATRRVLLTGAIRDMEGVIGTGGKDSNFDIFTGKSLTMWKDIRDETWVDAAQKRLLELRQIVSRKISNLVETRTIGETPHHLQDLPIDSLRMLNVLARPAIAPAVSVHASN